MASTTVHVDRETSRAAHAGFDTDVLAQPSRVCPLLSPGPATFPCTSMIAFLSSFSSSLRRISLRLAAAFLRPEAGYAPPCAKALSPQELTHLAGSRRSCRASLGLPGSRGTTILFHSLSASPNMFVFSAFTLL